MECEPIPLRFEVGFDPRQIGLTVPRHPSSAEGKGKGKGDGNQEDHYILVGLKLQLAKDDSRTKRELDRRSEHGHGTLRIEVRGNTIPTTSRALPNPPILMRRPLSLYKSKISRFEVFVFTCCSLTCVGACAVCCHIHISLVSSPLRRQRLGTAGVGGGAASILESAPPALYRSSMLTNFRFQRELNLSRLHSMLLMTRPRLSLSPKKAKPKISMKLLFRTATARNHWIHFAHVLFLTRCHRSSFVCIEN